MIQLQEQESEWGKVDESERTGGQKKEVIDNGVKKGRNEKKKERRNRQGINALYVLFFPSFAIASPRE
jgi:hypothetical protein